MSTAQDQGYRHILKYTGIFGGVQGLQLVLGLLRTKLMAILLAPSGMGLASLFQSTSQFLSQATNLGVSMSAVRQLSEDYETADTDGQGLESAHGFVRSAGGAGVRTRTQSDYL